MNINNCKLCGGPARITKRSFKCQVICGGCFSRGPFLKEETEAIDRWNQLHKAVAPESTSEVVMTLHPETKKFVNNLKYSPPPFTEADEPSFNAGWKACVSEFIDFLSNKELKV